MFIKKKKNCQDVLTERMAFRKLAPSSEQKKNYIEPERMTIPRLQKGLK